MSAIGFIGTGHIAAPMARHLAAKSHEIFVSERNLETAADLENSIGATVLSNQEVLDASEIIFLCLRPHVSPEILPELKFRADHKIISVMAGIPFAQLQKECAPASEFEITIPLGFLEKGGCPLPGFPNATVLTQLFSPENPVLSVASEDALNRHFAICALVPGLLDLLATGAAWLGNETGDVDAAEFYATQLLSGFLAATPKGKAGSLATERDALATEGTLSIQMTSSLRNADVHDVVKRTLAAIGEHLTPPA